MNGSPKIALFGGTFNPPHTGHISACTEFAKAISPDVLYIMPSSVPPHKEMAGKGSAAQRFSMARIAFRNMPCTTVFSAMELARDGKSYTVDTVESLIKLHGCEKIYMYVGSDMLFWFENWKDFRKLFEKCILVTAARSEEDAGNIKACCENFRKKYGCEYILLPLVPLEISSTKLRGLFEDSNADVSAQKECKKYLTDELYGYIIENAVYSDADKNSDITDNETLLRIREALPSQIDEKRLSHTLSVEKTALDLAEVYLPLYGYGKEYFADISAAALLHDFTKRKSDEWHESYLNTFMRGHEGYCAVYHSWSGAYFALENYGVNTRVFRAVYNHTTGRAGMDIFEKIIFIADFTEPGRTHKCCTTVREELCGLMKKYAGNEKMLKESLDSVILKSLENTESHLSSCGAKICPALYETAEFLKNNKEI